MKLFGTFSELFRRQKARTRTELAFMPAALEIVETPAPPMPAAIGSTIIVLFCFALAWACFGRIDIVTVAPGKVISNGRSKLIQPLETGVVRAIQISDGQKVVSGQLLIELDSTVNEAELNHIRGDLRMSEFDVARLIAALEADGDPLAAFHPPAGSSPAMVSAQRQFLVSQVGEYRAKIAVLNSERSQKEAELATIRATLAKLETVLPVLQERVEIRKTLYSHEVGSKVNYLEILQALVENQQEALVQKSRSREAEQAIAVVTEKCTETAAEYRRALSAELMEAEKKAAGLREDVKKAEKRTELQRLSAPIDGTVQQLSVHTIGGVVTPAQTLLVIVPTDDHLQIEAMVSNRDIGFIRPDQPVEIKVDTFNFTRYGLLQGKILSISQDAIIREKTTDKTIGTNSDALTNSSEPVGQELLYAALISLDRMEIQLEERLANLSSGMAVTVEIKTGSRRIIGYLISPLIRYRQEMLRER